MADSTERADQSEGAAKPPIEAGWTKWRTIVELSSVATLVSFILSAGILFSVLERNGVSFSAAVGVNDIVVYGVAQLLSTLTWMVYLLPPAILLYLIIKFSVLTIRSTLQSKTKIRTILFLIVLIMLLVINVAITFFYADENIDATPWTERILTTDKPYTRLVNDVGLIWVYGSLLIILLIAYAAERYLIKHVKANKVKDEQERAHDIIERISSQGRIMLSLFFAFSLFQAGYASYSKLDRDFTTGIGHLLESQRPRACAPGSTVIVNWIGETSLIVRCDRIVSVIKGSDNIYVSLGLPAAGHGGAAGAR